MKNIIRFIFIVFLSIKFIAKGQNKNIPDGFGQLQFRELANHKKVDYRATLFYTENNEEKQFDINTLNDTLLKARKYKIFVHVTPIFKINFTIDSNVILEIQLPGQGQVKVSCPKKGALRFLEIRGTEIIEPPIKEVIEDAGMFSLTLSEGRYKVTFQPKNGNISELLFKVKADEKTILTF